MNFDDREKRYDRQVNRLLVEYRKYISEDTCPTCNCKECLIPIRDSFYDTKTKKIIMTKWKHDHDRCFRWYSMIVLTATNTKKQLGGKQFHNQDEINRVIEYGLKRLKSMNRRFVEKGK
jgi:hypothetical protein